MMRFYHSFTLSALILIYLLSDNALGAPPKGRYMWLKCNPDGKNANCIENKGPAIELFGKPHRISSRAVNEIDPVESSEESSEAEESGDGSGDLFNFILPESRKARDSGVENRIENEPEKSKLSAKILREDNFIE